MSTPAARHSFSPDANVILIGPRGAGKTVSGTQLARRLHRLLMDTDAEIESRAECSVREFFQQRGEEAFRDLESRVIAEACAGRRQVISVGGGGVLRERNRTLLRDAGACFWLDAPAHVLMERVQSDPRSQALRPALTDQPLPVEIAQLRAAREPAYAATADFRLDTTALDPSAVAEQILARLAELGIQPEAAP